MKIKIKIIPLLPGTVSFPKLRVSPRWNTDSSDHLVH